MSAKILTAGFPKFAGESPLAKHIRNLGRWLLQRVSPVASARERALVVEERVAIGPKKALVLVRCDGQKFLVATAGDTVGPVIEIVPQKAARRSRKGREA
ncbi:MAG: flagellar biosynthetic protein FliO [Acidobacteriaceae bacterium]